ncbi:hypothetical protein BDV93DRAFT_578560 [Ceratobasidium sp. AG-I]|nr:hypothetical protein BDV93DRAFT_578560 [Ceratobasidium sp. AG-I]
MVAFASLPGELTAIIRECIPSDDLTTHLALYIVARGASLALYNENIWRELCHANGFGGMFSKEVIEGWRKSILVLARYQERMGISHTRRYGPLQWAKAPVPRGPPLASYSGTSLELNPAFASLSFDRRALLAGKGIAATYLHSQTANLECHPLNRTVADHIADVVPTQLTHHIGAYSLATAPPVSELNITFDHWGSDFDGNIGREACSFSSDLALVQREDGVRVIDVVEGILKWLAAPLTDDQVNKLVELDRLLDPELYAMLEFSTDPDTLSAYWKRKYRCRGDVFRANFAGVRTVDDTPNTVRAVWCPEIRFDALGYDGIVNGKALGETEAAGGWLTTQMNRIASMA